MQQNTLIKPTPYQNLLSLNIQNINQLFSGFTTGDFVVLYDSQYVHALSMLLCVRAQLPSQLGGLSSNVIFIDGANTFRLYQITRLARLHQLNPKQVLDHIYISRAFTAYQMTSLILQKLEAAIKTFNAKLIIISDIATMFLDKDVEDDEAKRIYNQVTAYLSKFIKEHEVIVIVTYSPNIDNKRNIYLHALTLGRANVVLSLKQTKYKREVVLEKHPTLPLGSAQLASELLPLTAFLEA